MAHFSDYNEEMSEKPDNNSNKDYKMAADIEQASESSGIYTGLHQRNTNSAHGSEAFPMYQVPKEIAPVDIESEKAEAEKKRKRTRYIIGGSVFAIVLLLIILISVSPSGNGVAGGGGGGMLGEMGKSKHQIITDCKVKFEDVQGCDEVKDQVEKIVRFLKDPTEFERFGANMPHGYLFAGPPGVGKTMLAKAVAGESGVPFLSISGAEFDEMLVGVGAARVRDLFSTARNLKKAVIFIDEIDAIASKRSSLGLSDSTSRQTINQLLVEMDGFRPSDGIVVLAATNTPDVLDPAILRPGRFDKTFFLTKPDFNGRMKLLESLIKAIPSEKREAGDLRNLELAWLAKITVDYTGADLTNLVNHAKMIASLDKDAKVITKVHLMEAKEFVDLGPKRSLKMTDEDRALTAHHEAGHAIVTLCNEGVFSAQYATIVPRGQALGLVFVPPEADMHSISFKTMKDHMDVKMGGFVGEKMYRGGDINLVTTGASSDFKGANYYARMAVMAGFGKRTGFLVPLNEGKSELSEKAMNDIEEDIKELLAESYKRVEALINQEGKAWKAIADALIKKGSLNREDMVGLFNNNVTNAHKRKIK